MNENKKFALDETNVGWGRITKKLMVLVCIMLLASVCLIGGYKYGVTQGQHEGYDVGILDGFNLGNSTGFMRGLLEGINFTATMVRTKYGIDIEVIDHGNGTYSFHMVELQGSQFSINIDMHCLVEQFRDGVLIASTYHAMTMTNYGKNWTAYLMSGAVTGGWASTNYLQNMTWIGVSNQSASVSATWLVIPDEITTDGLSRAEGTNTVDDSTFGKWNCSKTFTATGSNSTQTYGTYLGSYASKLNTLIAVEKQGAIKNLEASDTLAVTITTTIS